MAASIHVKGAKWKDVEIDPNLLSAKHFDCLLSIQELTDYELVKPGETRVKKSKKKNLKEVKEKANEDDKVKLKKKRKGNVETHSDSTVETNVNTNENKSKEKLKKQRKKERKKLVSKTKVLELVEEYEAEVEQDKKRDNLLKQKHQKRKHSEKGNEAFKSKKQKLSSEEATKDDLDTNAEDTKKEEKLNDNEEIENVKKGMTGWRNLFVPDEVLKALKDNGFMAPTPIQSLVLPHAIRDKLDIVGAAETGSGKTLAFGIPLIDKILKHRKYEKKHEAQMFADDDGDESDGGSEKDLEEESHDEDEDDDDDDESDDASEKDLEEDKSHDDEDDDDDDDDDDDESDIESEERIEYQEGAEEFQGDGIGCVRVIEDADFSDLNLVHPLVNTVDKSPLALVLEPTRELAVQVKNHLQAVSKHSNIKIAIIVGGMSVQKQRRVLKKCPDIIIATPGRLWELMQQGEAYLSRLEDIKGLVIDEADRMVEKGHFEELTKILDHLNANQDKKKRRQTLVFSATLTMIHSGPHRPMAKKVKLTEKAKLEMLMKKIGLKDKPKVIDLTKKTGTVETLTEARINCTKEEKDLYLYYFMQQHPGRTLVFANSKDCIRRLVSIFMLLQTNPLPLHADMHQKQRLKNLERFTANERGFLLASDVAARGLDIPNVQHVIHYQVPLTVENYIHRSGRTARASKEGLSVMLIGQEDVKNYRKIIHTLNRNEDLPLFPVDQQYLPGLKQRISLAQQVDKLEHRFKKKKVQNDWFHRAAREMDIEIDDENLLNDLGDSADQASHNQHIKQMKLELSALLRQSVTPKFFSGKYPTKSGRLVTPKQEDSQSAIQKVKKDKQVQKNLEKLNPMKPKVLKQKKNKWKKKWKGKS